MEFEEVTLPDEKAVKELSEMASAIVKEYYDPIIGAMQNDYMIEKFQSVPAIKRQLSKGYRYYMVRMGEDRIGFIAFYPRGSAMYLSKLYLYKRERGKGYARPILDFVIAAAKAEGLTAIELNVNRNNDTVHIYEKLGFEVLREEKNDIGNGFFMDDFVYQLCF